MQTNDEGHVAVLAFPFGTHAAPLLNLVCRLAKAAPNTRFSFLNTSKSNDKIFSRIRADEYGNIVPYNVDDGVPVGHVFSGNPLEVVSHFVKAIPGNFNESLKVVVAKTGMKVTCLLTDAFFWFGGDLAEEMGVPWVALWTASPFAMSLHMYTDDIRSRFLGNGENLNLSLDFIPSMSAIRAKDLPDGVLRNSQSPITAMAHKMGQTIHRTTALVMNSFEEMDQTVYSDLRSRLKMLLSTGPFNLASSPPSYSDEGGCIRWLDQHNLRSVAYLSFGSILTPPPNELIALAEALEAQRVPFLWSFRDNSKFHLIEEFISRAGTLGKIVPWTPQLQVLEHASVGVFITHAGWNSVLESIAGGVPMISRPFFADQKLNSRLVEDVWHIGVSVEGGTFTKYGTMRALEHIISSDEGEKMRENINVLREKAKRAVGSDGSSTTDFKTLLKVVSGCNQST